MKQRNSGLKGGKLVQLILIRYCPLNLDVFPSVLGCHFSETNFGERFY